VLPALPGNTAGQYLPVLPEGTIMAKVTISFSLDSERDRQVLRYLEGLPRGEKSAAIREALDAHLGGGGVTLSEVYQAVKDIERKLAEGIVLAQAGVGEAGSQVVGEEPVDVAANLDALGL
jgi:hypothetical protein